MFIISLTYTAPIEVLDGLLADHRAWLDRGIEDGWLLLAGRREPRTGGILIARGEKAEIAAKAATDPFVVNGAASFDLIEFLPARAASVNLETLLP
ncbi:GTP cyclohydrolase [Sphingobium lactosutens]|uniref:YciI family protein n=1 Tax=Sphingobium lactosutens TaxID=522773 RepID=UPI0015B9B1C8|nr:YciI family protein [Sphingobium lactosutens]NWK94153.1 GTP cyclohydrolase [Sphingobium lactosutens]